MIINDLKHSENLKLNSSALVDRETQVQQEAISIEGGFFGATGFAFADVKAEKFALTQTLTQAITFSN